MVKATEPTVVKYSSAISDANFKLVNLYIVVQALFFISTSELSSAVPSSKQILALCDFLLCWLEMLMTIHKYG